MKFRLIISFIFTSFFVMNAQAFVTVGFSDDCDYNQNNVGNQIQLALNDGTDEIRLTTEQAFTNSLVITNSTLDLVGGYANCLDADANNISTNKTQFDGTNLTHEFLHVIGQANTMNINFKNLEFFDSTDLNSSIYIDHVSGAINFENVHIHDNIEHSFAGGIFIFNDDTNQDLSITLLDSIIRDNQSETTGGLSCRSDGDVDILILGQSGVSFNTGNWTGGGISLVNCNLTINSGTESPSDANPLGVHGNEAVFGGGLYVTGGAQVLLQGIGTSPVNITNNTAENSGGGISLNGNIDLGTQLTAYATLISNNHTENHGGAVISKFGGQVDFLQTENCPWRDGLCHLFENNSATNGGTFYLEESAYIHIEKSEVTGSRSLFSGAVAALFDSDSLLTINGSLIHHNGDADHTDYNDWYLIRNIGQNNHISISHSTISDNDVQFNTLLPFRYSPELLRGQLTLIATIINDDVPAIDSPPTSTVIEASSTMNCVMLGNNNSDNPDLYQSYEQVNVGIPQFINPELGDYHLNINDTLVIDQCDEQLYPALLSDVDDEARPFDVLDIPNVAGIMDIGFDEYNNDVIFSHGFE